MRRGCTVWWAGVWRVAALLVLAAAALAVVAAAQEVSETIYIQVVPAQPVEYVVLGPVYQPASVTSVYSVNGTPGASPPGFVGVVSSAYSVVNVTLLLAYRVSAPERIETCLASVTYTITVYNIYTGAPAQNVELSLYVNGSLAGVYSIPAGVATVTVNLPSGAYGTYIVEYVINGFVVGNTTIVYVNCVGGGVPGVAPAPGVNATATPPFNVTAPFFEWPSVEVAQPRLDTPTGIFVAGVLLSLWLWMARFDVAYATMAIGAVMVVLGGIYGNGYLATMGGFAVAAGAMYRVLSR